MPRPSRLAGTRQPVALVMVAMIHLGRGLRLLLDTAPTYSPETAVLHDLLPHGWHATAWLAVGVALAGLALTSTRRCWWLAILLPSLTAISYGWSVVMWVIPGPPPGLPSALGQVIIWAAITGLIYIIAGWPESDVERDA